MAFWNLFQKKNEKKDPEAGKSAASKPADGKPAVNSGAKSTPAAKAPAANTATPAKSPSTAKAPASSVKPATTKPQSSKTPAPAVKSSAPKSAPTAPKAVKISSEPARQPARNNSGYPFFATTEEDIRLAFDAAIAEAEAEIARNIAKNGTKAVGKYEFNLEVDGYHFYLIANNGQVLFDSPSFTTLIGALNGIKTFKKTVLNGEFDIKVDKYKRYRFILANKYYGENYTTREQCQKCAESVRNFADNAHIIRYTPDKEAVIAYETARLTKNSADNVDWNAIARAEATAQKKGKFEICQEKDEFCFYLLASNGQILYSSRYYANENACRKGIESFKRAAYVGNFFVDRDKFGNYRYVLKNIGSAPSFIGESYDNKPQCEKIIESVKNFIVTATIENESKEEAPEEES